MSESNKVKVFEQAPHPALRPFLRRFLVVEFPELHHDVHLPDTGSVAAFSLRGECLLDDGQPAPSAAFTGLRETLRSHAHHHHTVLLAMFTPVGAAAFLRPPQEELVGRTTDLSGLACRSGEFAELHEQFTEAPTHERRVQLLENFFLIRLRDSAPDPLVMAAVKWLEKGQGARRIDDLAQYIGLSQSALERRFRRVIGVSPKKFASVVRLQQAVRLRATGVDFTQVAQGAGYFDQSHFIKDFRRATGSPPEAFFRQANTA